MELPIDTPTKNLPEGISLPGMGRALENILLSYADVYGPVFKQTQYCHPQL